MYILILFKLTTLV